MRKSAWVYGLIVITAGFADVAASGKNHSSASAASLPAAIKKVQAGDLAGAAKMLESITEREPGNADAWRLLGVVRLKKKELEGAGAAFDRSLAAAPDSPKAMYGKAQVLALGPNKDQALEWLEKAKAHRMDMTGIEVDANLSSLKADPRFAKLLPRPEEFANPFVEPVKVIREWDGEAANDQFGWIARNIGDVDGDGINDFVTSAPTCAGGRRERRARLRLLDRNRPAALEGRRPEGRRARHGSRMRRRRQPGRRARRHRGRSSGRQGVRLLRKGRDRSS